ncbi:UNKNOWN [Stylonychia lemnae]|uniref:Uncharacterized protein n=1 Tax=Stylonychia lemnae TaxID=5949 RepID=A0A078AJU3_STYLE|nr:UNKNOWN [Stylonychia lemnae]|eukprot:CDW81078.1 UNKNOWN [Stylonychia lemnae]
MEQVKYLPPKFSESLKDLSQYLGIHGMTLDQLRNRGDISETSSNISYVTSSAFKPKSSKLDVIREHQINNEEDDEDEDEVINDSKQFQKSNDPTSTQSSIAHPRKLSVGSTGNNQNSSLINDQNSPKQLTQQLVTRFNPQKPSQRKRYLEASQFLKQGSELVNKSAQFMKSNHNNPQLQDQFTNYTQDNINQEQVKIENEIQMIRERHNNSLLLNSTNNNEDLSILDMTAIISNSTSGGYITTEDVLYEEQINLLDLSGLQQQNLQQQSQNQINNQFQQIKTFNQQDDQSSIFSPQRTPSNRSNSLRQQAIIANTKKGYTPKFSDDSLKIPRKNHKRSIQNIYE